MVTLNRFSRGARDLAAIAARATIAPDALVAFVALDACARMGMQCVSYSPAEVLPDSVWVMGVENVLFATSGLPVFGSTTGNAVSIPITCVIRWMPSVIEAVPVLRFDFMWVSDQPTYPGDTGTLRPLETL